MTRKLSTPFAINSTLKNILPITATSAQTAKGLADYTNGWTAINKLPIENGGQPPYMEDMNGLLGDITGNIVDLNMGLPQYFDSDYSSLIGGYPIGARLVLNNNSTTVISTIANNTNNPNSNMTGWVTFASVELKTQYATVNTPSDLSSLSSGSLAFVKSIGKWFIYNSSNTESANGVTVVGNWVMQPVDAYYSSWFASSSATTNQAPSLRIGYAYATSKGKPFIQNESYWVDSDLNSGNSNSDTTAILALSNSSYIFNEGCYLNKISNSESHYSLFLFTNGVSNVLLDKANINGDRLNHDYSDGGTHEWGFGIYILDCSNVIVNYPTVQNCTGDGIYLGKPWGIASIAAPTNVKVLNPYISKCRRNGLSFTSGSNSHIYEPTIIDIGDYDSITGAYPKASIDIEPESGNSSYPAYLDNCSITDPYLDGSFRALSFYNSDQKSSFDMHIRGLMRIKNAGNTCVEISSRAEATGTLRIDKIEFVNIIYRGITQWVRSDQSFNCVIGEVINSSSSNAQFNYFTSYDDNSKYTTLGNFQVDKITSNGSASSFSVNLDADISKYTAEIVIKDTSGASITQSLNQSYLPKWGANHYINAILSYSDGGTYRAYYSAFNTILYDTSANNGGASIANEVWMFNDLSKKKIIIDPNSNIIGTLNITGLRIPTQGATYSKLTSSNRGAIGQVQVSSSATKVFELINFTFA